MRSSALIIVFGVGALWPHSSALAASQTADMQVSADSVIDKLNNKFVHRAFKAAILDYTTLGKVSCCGQPKGFLEHCRAVARFNVGRDIPKELEPSTEDAGEEVVGEAQLQKAQQQDAQKEQAAMQKCTKMDTILQEMVHDINGHREGARGWESNNSIFGMLFHKNSRRNQLARQAGDQNYDDALRVQVSDKNSILSTLKERMDHTKKWQDQFHEWGGHNNAYAESIHEKAYNAYQAAYQKIEMLHKDGAVPA